MLFIEVHIHLPVRTTSQWQKSPCAGVKVSEDHQWLQNMSVNRYTSLRRHRHWTHQHVHERKRGRGKIVTCANMTQSVSWEVVQASYVSRYELPQKPMSYYLRGKIFTRRWLNISPVHLLISNTTLLVAGHTHRHSVLSITAAGIVTPPTIPALFIRRCINDRYAIRSQRHKGYLLCNRLPTGQKS